MSNKRDNDGKLFSDNKRITKLGNFLRKTSIDEIPSLWNVVKGDMSLVGPRPLLVEYLKSSAFCINSYVNINSKNFI